MDGIDIIGWVSGNEIAIVRWVHILAMVYWLGGEWGVFQSSYFVVNRKLAMDERRRHMETAYRIDILARTGIILLMPLGLHMGELYGFVPILTGYIGLMWLAFASWLSLTWAAFFTRETDLGIRLTKIDEAVRYIYIPTVLLIGLGGLFNFGIYDVADGTYWFATKTVIYGGLLVIGLLLRFIMREWTTLFRVLDAGPNEQAEARLEWSIRRARLLAYIYWVGIASTAFVGAVKPF